MNRTVRMLGTMLFVFVAFVSPSASVASYVDPGPEYGPGTTIFLERGQGITQALVENGYNKDCLCDVMETSSIAEERLRDLPIGTALFVRSICSEQTLPIDSMECSRSVMRRDMERHRDVGYNVFGELIADERSADAGGEYGLLKVQYEQLERKLGEMRTETDALKSALAVQQNKTEALTKERGDLQRALEVAGVELNALSVKLQEAHTRRGWVFFLAAVASLIVGVGIGWYWRFGYIHDLRSGHRREFEDARTRYGNDVEKLRVNLANARAKLQALGGDNLVIPRRLVVGPDEGFEGEHPFTYVKHDVDPAYKERKSLFYAHATQGCKTADLQVDPATLGKERLVRHLASVHGIKYVNSNIRLVPESEARTA